MLNFLTYKKKKQTKKPHSNNYINWLLYTKNDIGLVNFNTMHYQIT